MNFISLVLSSLFFLIFPLFLSAEESVKSYTPQRQTILDFKNELNLNETQIKEIEKFLVNFKKRETEIQKEIQKHDSRLRELLRTEGDINEIRKEVREIYRLRGELVADELETARKIDGLLNPEQKQKWREIRARGIKK